MVFFGDDPLKALPRAGTHSDVRIQYFRDVTKDVELTHYLLRNFSRNKEFYSSKSTKDFHHFSEVSNLVDDFRRIAKKLKSKEKDFGPSIIDIK